VSAAGPSSRCGDAPSIIIGIFSYAMFVLYLAWVPPGTVKRLPDTFKHATTKRRARRERIPAPATDVEGHVHAYQPGYM
jgi:hypothetical protein